MPKSARILVIGVLGLLRSQAASAEMMKGQSMGEALWAMAFLVAGIPFAIGFGVSVLIGLVEGNRPPLGVTMLVSCSCWWAGLYLMWNQQPSGASSTVSVWPVVLVVLVLTGIVGFLSVSSSSGDDV